MAQRSRHRPLITVGIIAKNEEDFIGTTIKSCRRLKAEVLVGDTGSTDRTAEIAARGGARVFSVPWRNDFAAAKNAVLDRARGAWVLFIDADEWIRDGDQETIRRLIAQYHADLSVGGFSVYQTNLLSLAGKEVMDKARTVRIFRNRPTTRYRYAIHEQITQSVQGKVLYADIEFIHAGFTAEVTIKKNKSARNIEIITELIQNIDHDDPHQIYLMTQLGREYQRLGKFADAEEHYKRAVDRYTSGIDDGTIQTSPFGSILFSYVAETLEIQAKRQEVLAYARRMRPYGLFPQADLPFFTAMAYYNLHQYPEALSAFMEALACIRSGRLLQEYLSTDRVVLTYAGLLDSAAKLNAGTEFMGGILVEALTAYPNRDLLGKVAANLLARMEREQVEALVGQIPPQACSTIAQWALQLGFGWVCTMASEAAISRGSHDANLWAGVLGMHMQHDQAALALLNSIPEDHVSYPLSRVLAAMAEYNAGNREAYEDALKRLDPLIATHVRQWAGERIPDDAVEMGDSYWQTLGQILPVPVAKGGQHLAAEWMGLERAAGDRGDAHRSQNLRGPRETRTGMTKGGAEGVDSRHN